MAKPGRGVRVDITAIQDFRSDLGRAPRNTATALQKAAQSAVRSKVVPKVRAGAPRRSGRLRGSVRAVTHGRQAELVVGGRDVPYAGVINWGWPAKNIRGQEFIYKGIVQASSEMMKIYTESVNKVLRVVAPKGTL